MDHTTQETQQSFADLVETSFRMVRNVRQRYGMSRFELGLLLDTIQEQKLWVGKAQSFPEYLDDLRLNRNACRSYIRVAKKFIGELKVSDGILAQLATCNFSVLEKAALVVNIDNAQDVISAVLALHQRDALFVLNELDPALANRPESDDVTKLFGRYMQLPDDSRIEFLNRLRPKRKEAV